MTLENRVAIVTGATGSLGRVAVRSLAQRGAELVLVSTRAERLRELAREIALPPEKVLIHGANLREPNASLALAQSVRERFGRADVLLHLVGGWTGGKTVIEAAAGEIEEMLQQHLWTTTHLAQALVPLFTANHWGRIIVVSSPLATRPAGKSAPYAIAKAAQETLMLTLAQELEGTGVTANVLQVRTIEARPEHEGALKKRGGTTPEEIMATVFYLCSDEAQVVNGARIPLYGPT